MSSDRYGRLTSLRSRASAMGLYAVDSEYRGILYVYEDGEIVVSTGNSHIRLTLSEAENVAGELAEIVADIKDSREKGLLK